MFWGNMQLPSLDALVSWPAPNHTNPQTRGSVNLVINILFFLLALFVVCMRLYARIRISKSFGWDDGLIVAAMFPATAFAIIGILTATRFQWDRHIWDVDFKFVQIGAELSIVTEILFAFATNLTKLSLLSLIYRIVSKGPGYLWKFIIGLMVFIVAQGSAFILTVLFQCGRPSAYWTMTLDDQHCISETKNLLAAGIVNTLTDLLVVFLPMPMVYRLQLPTQQQVAIIVLFGVGFLVTLAGAVRTAFLYRATTSFDKTWLAYPVYIASSVELYIGIICASIPATKRFFSYFIPRVLPDGAWPGYRTDQTTMTIGPPSRLSSVMIGDYNQKNYSRVLPSHTYQDDKIAAFPDPCAHPYVNTYPMRSGKVPVQLVAFVTPEQAKMNEKSWGRRSPDSGEREREEMGYMVTQTKSRDGLVPTRPFRPNPTILPRPPPSYQNIH